MTKAFEIPQEYFFSPDARLLETAARAQADCADFFMKTDEIAEYNGQKVLSAFITSRVSESCLKGTTGYGYGDIGREAADAVFAKALGAQDALVRHTFVNGTHALSTALFGLLRPNDTLLCATGKPYDTLEEVLGIRKNVGNGSLADFGVKYAQVDLLPDGKPDLAAIQTAAKTAKVCYIQRSRGYALRPSLTVDTIGEIAAAVKSVNPQILVMVDNCYGEFTETREPTQAGADLMVGSLIKNAGGGVASTGGYIAGRTDLVELCADRLNVIGMGKEIGCTLNQSREILLGFFLAPQAAANAVKTAAFAARFFELLGFEAYPKYNEPRTDIITSVLLQTPERLIAFCQGIQKGSPVDSYVLPEAWDMPGYDSKVIMAAGAFTMGASIELSADAPLREPYAVWLQGGLTYPTGKAGVLRAAQELLDRGLLDL